MLALSLGTGLGLSFFLGTLRGGSLFFLFALAFGLSAGLGFGFFLGTLRGDSLFLFFAFALRVGAGLGLGLQPRPLLGQLALLFLEFFACRFVESRRSGFFLGVRRCGRGLPCLFLSSALRVGAGLGFSSFLPGPPFRGLAFHLCLVGDGRRLNRHCGRRFWGRFWFLGRLLGKEELADLADQHRRIVRFGNEGTRTHVEAAANVLG